ncbi:hypothetical protein scyTo_0007280 [Scyliorhinus torazame]|uniref:Uncharacterized protein n=1 Tax=Scyliorhinus torazame TaxID=75743 RepID=A0A401NPI7_SCYTO|nr:hypothetical protein [Scyliorhinus torazame]
MVLQRCGPCCTLETAGGATRRRFGACAVGSRSRGARGPDSEAEIWSAVRRRQYMDVAGRNGVICPSLTVLENIVMAQYRED